MAFPTAVNDQITDSITQPNVTSIASVPGNLSNLSLSNLVSNTNLSQQSALANQQAMNSLNLALLSQLTSPVFEETITEEGKK